MTQEMATTEKAIGDPAGHLRRHPHKKALLIGISYTSSGGQTSLRGPRKDVFDMRQLLVEQYDYEDEQITILVDIGGPKSLQPTRSNILARIGEFTSDAQADDKFFFYYSGHAIQVENRKMEHGMDVGLVPVDPDDNDSFIGSQELHESLVDPLPSQCTFVAIFDTAHSGSLLGLKHAKCNAVYTPWVSKGKRRSATLWNNRVRRNDIITSPNQPDELQSSTSEHSRTVQEGMEPMVYPTLYLLDSSSRRTSSPERLFPCDGYCRDRKGSECQDDRLVISLSAARDDQRSWEDQDGSSMTVALIRLLNEDPSPTFRSLLTRVSHDMHRSYLILHAHAREYKKKYHAATERARKMNRPVRKPQEVEIDNFLDPQLSSLYPLNMDEQLHL